MGYPVVSGAVLLEANGAALNNAGQEPGSRVENAIVVKQIRIGRMHYPYVSGQAWRRWWREVLYEDFGWEPSPVTAIKNPQQAFTAGDPVRYAEDDLFGYLVARKRGQSAGTFRRVAPLKNSLLISVLPNIIIRDFAHFTRNLPAGASPLLYEAEHYTGYLQGVFTISLSDVGRFEVGEMHDLAEEMANSYLSVLERQNGVYRLAKGERVKRVQEVLQALARLRGGARLTRNLSEVAPVAVLVGFVDGGNAPFQRLFEPDELRERVQLNLQRLKAVLVDYKERLLAPSQGGALLFGYYPTVLANEDEVISAFEGELHREVEVVGTPQQALERAAHVVASIFDKHVS